MTIADLRLQCCINGSRGIDEHPAAAQTPGAGAREAAAAVAAGARDLHVHPHTADGRDSVAPEHVADWLNAIREVVDVPVGITTGAWAWSGGLGVAEAIAAWHVLPDHASVNWHEPAAETLCAALQERGVAINVGLWSEDEAESWLESDWPPVTNLVLIEIPDLPDQDDSATRMLEIVAPSGRPVLLHGEERSAWPMIELAARLGIPTRIGLEDVLHAPDGRDVDGNAELVRLAVSRLSG